MIPPLSSARRPSLALVSALVALSPAASHAAGEDGGTAAAPIPVARLVELARSVSPALPGMRIEIEPGRLDPRLKLAPCRRIEPYLPTGSTAWGRTRVGLRCTDGEVAWNVFLPVTVRVWSRAVVSAVPLQAGADLRAEDLRVDEIDIAEGGGSPVFQDPQALVGRRLGSMLPPGTPLRAMHLRVRQWFAAGETVTITYRGEGFSVSSEGQALGAGLDGQPVRVRTPSGRVVSGQPVGEREVEIRS